MSGVMGKYLLDAKDLTATWLVTVRLLGAGICLLLLMYQRKGNSIFRVASKKIPTITVASTSTSSFFGNLFSTNTKNTIIKIGAEY